MTRCFYICIFNILLHWNNDFFHLKPMAILLMKVYVEASYQRAKISQNLVWAFPLRFIKIKPCGRDLAHRVEQWQWTIPINVKTSYTQIMVSTSSLNPIEIHLDLHPHLYLPNIDLFPSSVNLSLINEFLWIYPSHVQLIRQKILWLTHVPLYPPFPMPKCDSEWDPTFTSI